MEDFPLVLCCKCNDPKRHIWNFLENYHFTLKIAISHFLNQSEKLGVLKKEMGFEGFKFEIVDFNQYLEY